LRSQFFVSKFNIRTHFAADCDIGSVGENGNLRQSQRVVGAVGDPRLGESRSTDWP